MREKRISIEKPYTAIQLVFLNSRVNGAQYHGDTLPLFPRVWPQQTFLQRRLAQIRDTHPRSSDKDAVTDH